MTFAIENAIDGKKEIIKYDFENQLFDNGSLNVAEFLDCRKVR